MKGVEGATSQAEACVKEESTDTTALIVFFVLILIFGVASFFIFLKRFAKLAGKKLHSSLIAFTSMFAIFLSEVFDLGTDTVAWYDISQSTNPDLQRYQDFYHVFGTISWFVSIFAISYRCYKMWGLREELKDDDVRVQPSEGVKIAVTAQVLSVWTGLDLSSATEILNSDQGADEIVSIGKTLDEKKKEYLKCDEDIKEVAVVFTVLLAEDIPFFTMNVIIIKNLVMDKCSQVESSVFVSTGFNLVMLGTKLNKVFGILKLILRKVKLGREIEALEKGLKRAGERRRSSLRLKEPNE